MLSSFHNLFLFEKKSTGSTSALPAHVAKTKIVMILMIYSSG